MSKLTTITGRIHFLGPSTYNQHLSTYQAIEFTTDSGRFDLGETTVPMEVDRVMKVGNDISILVIEGVGPKKGKHIVLAAYDKGQKRTFLNEEMSLPKRALKKQAIATSWISVIGIPLGLAFLVVPGLLVMYLLYLAWDTYNQMPEDDIVKAKIAELPRQFERAEGMGGASVGVGLAMGG